MARLEWQHNSNWRDWRAYSGLFKATGRLARWLIYVTPEGKFSLSDSSPVLKPTEESFTTLAEAQAWCQKHEDELCQKT